MSEEESLLSGNDTQSDDQTTETTTETTTDPSWFLNEGVAGEGDAPEWFKGDKFKSVAAQAEAYKGLESKLGGFTGAPEDGYELSFPEGVEGEWIEGDPLMEGFQTWAKDNNLSQDKFTDLLHLYVGNESQVAGTDRESELAAIGDNAQARLQNISDYAKANLSEEDYQGILAATTTAAGVKAIEALIAKTRGVGIPTDMSESNSGISHADLRERKADPRNQTDPAFRKETSAMYAKVFGSEPKKTTVG